MAQGVGSGTITRFGQDTFGGHLYGAVDYKGSSSYVPGGDGPISHKMFGFQNTIITLIGSADQTNTYFVEPRPLQNDVTTWQLVWKVTATGLEVAAAVNLSGFTVRLSAIGV
jgi:hypothetical protein